MSEAAGQGKDQSEDQSEGPAQAGRDVQAQADATLGQLTAGLAPREAVLVLAVLVNRAGTRLHALSRAEASARKELPEWPIWAQLQNASRNLVLQASTCRDLALRLSGRKA